jgi:hypothetical protein
MEDIAEDLKDRFWLAELCILEKWEMVGLNADGKTIPDVWTDEEKAAMETFKALRESVNAVPPSLLETTAALRKDRPDLFERLFVQVSGAASSGIFGNATEFVKVLNLNIERMASFV